MMRCPRVVDTKSNASMLSGGTASLSADSRWHLVSKLPDDPFVVVVFLAFNIERVII